MRRWQKCDSDSHHLARGCENAAGEPVSHVHGHPLANRHALPAPSRVREEAAVASGRLGWSASHTPFPVTRCDRGGGTSRSPLPVSPYPTGRFSMDTVSGRRQTPDRLAHAPLTRPSGSIAIHCPHPGGGAVEERRSPGEGGEFAVPIPDPISSAVMNNDVSALPPPPPPRVLHPEAPHRAATFDSTKSLHTHPLSGKWPRPHRRIRTSLLEEAGDRSS